MVNKKNAEPAPGKNVAKLKGSSALVDPAMLKMMQADAGVGVLTGAEDNVIPLLYILQSNSPQLERADKVKFIKGAKAGDIWLRGTTVVIDGEEKGIEVVPCHNSKCWIEWRPDRGGFAARHKERPAEAVLTEVPSQKKGEDPKMVWRMPNGNTVVETREHVVIITEGTPKPVTLVAPMVSTNHTASKNWNGLMNNVFIPGTSNVAPCFGYKYRMRTVPKKNAKGSWYGWDIQHAGEEDGAAVPKMVNDLELYNAAKKIARDFSSGRLRADVPDDTTEESERNM